MLNTSRNVSPVWQSWGKVKLLFMTFKMAWGRQVGLCIKFIWNLHFDWPTVWANSTVTYRSDRDIWQLWTIAEMAFKTQTVRAGEIFPESPLIHLLSATPPPPPALGQLSVKPMETYFQRCKMKFFLRSTATASPSLAPHSTLGHTHRLSSSLWNPQSIQGLPAWDRWRQ